MKSKNDFGPVFWIHTVLLTAGYSSFLLIDWRLVLFGVFILKVHYSLNGNCFLTDAEFGKDPDRTFVWYYLKMIFPNLNKKRTKFVIRAVVPILLVVAAMTLQVFWDFEPFIK